MKVTATYKGAAVTIVDINVTGMDAYVTFIDASGNLTIDKSAGLSNTTSASTIATSATAV